MEENGSSWESMEGSGAGSGEQDGGEREQSGKEGEEKEQVGRMEESGSRWKRVDFETKNSAKIFFANIDRFFKICVTIKAQKHCQWNFLARDFKKFYP